MLLLFMYFTALVVMQNFLSFAIEVAALSFFWTSSANTMTSLFNDNDVIDFWASGEGTWYFTYLYI